MITDVILDDALVSVINQGITGIRRNDLNSIITTIDFLDSYISNSDSVMNDPYLSQNTNVVINNTRLREIYFNFRTLFDVYRIYLQQTNGVTPYNSWIYTRNTALPFNSTQPATYMSSLQPIWYVGRDEDQDGSLDIIEPEVNSANQVQNWATSTTSTANLYRSLRSSVDPASFVSGRVVRKKRGKMGGSKVGVKTSEMGSLEFVDGTYFDPIGVDDPGSDFQGGGGIRWEGESTTGDIPINTGGGGGGGISVDPSRVPRNWRDIIRNPFRNINSPLSGNRSFASQTLRSANGIPALPLGASTLNTFSADGLMSSGQFAPAGITDQQFVQMMSASPIGTNMNNLTENDLSAPAASFSFAAPQPRRISLPATCPNTKYSFKIRQVVDPTLPATKKFFGFNIKRDPKLVVTMYAACPNTPPTELFTIEVNSYPYFNILPDKNGNLVTVPKNSTSDAVGKIQYGYYYDVKDIITRIYQELPVITYQNNVTVYQDIIEQLSNLDGFKPFVDNFGPNMGISPGKDRQNTFWRNGSPPTGFITRLPASVQDLIIGNNSWYNDTSAYIAMSIIENFFFMGATEYRSITPNDIVEISSALQQQYPQNDRTDRSLTTLISSRVSGEVETSTNTGGGTGTGTGTRTGTGTGVGTGIGSGGSTALNAQTVDTQNQFYGKVSWSFGIATSNDCSAPFYQEGAQSGFLWNLVLDDQAVVNQKVYADAVVNLIDQTASSTGAVTGKIVDILRGDRNSPQFQLLLQNGLVPMRNAKSTTMEPIPGNPCLEGLREDYQWGLKRSRIIPYKIFCNKPGVGRVEIDYKSKPGSDIDKWVISILAKPNSGASRKISGELLKTADGYYYSTEDEVSPIEGRFPNEPGIYFSSYTSVQRSSTNLSCIPSSRTVSTWKVDLDNPCGCDEVEVLTHYVIYDEISYTNPLYGTTETFPQREVLDPAYPAPAPESRAAAYSLTVGQELTDNRREKPDCFERTGEGRLHHPFLYGTDILPGVRKKSIKGLFNLSQSLDCYYTSSTQTNSQKDYYYEITDCDNCNKTAYFAVAYGNHKGSGSISSGYEVNDSPSRAIYSQYRLLTLDPHEKYFTFYDGGSVNTPDDIYVINYYRNGLSDKLDIGNFEINIAELSGSGIANNVHTGSNVKVSGSNPKILTLIDNSPTFDSEDVCANDDPNYYYDIVSGSLTNGIHVSGTGSLETNEYITTYGKVYPNLGIIVLDGKKLNVSASFNSVTGSNINGDNSFKLFTAISGAAAVDKPMRARNVKFKTTNHYFVRIPSGEANYSNNPTYVIDNGTEKGRIKNTCFVDNPMTYITTIGLYNTKKELIAIAKLSKPIKKTKENDVLIKIRLNW
jgi:hypothetical protein